MYSIFQYSSETKEKIAYIMMSRKDGENFEVFLEISLMLLSMPISNVCFFYLSSEA